MIGTRVPHSLYSGYHRANPSSPPSTLKPYCRADHVEEGRSDLGADVRVANESRSIVTQVERNARARVVAGCTGQQSAVCSSPDGRFSPLFDSAGILSARSLR